MRRQDKYPETAYFIYHNQNPKNRITEDCEVRALSLATDIPYNDVVMELAEIHCETGYVCIGNKAEEIFLTRHGFKKMPQLRHDDNTKYTGKQFTDYLSINFPNGEIGNVFAHIGGNHVVCIKPTNHGDGFNCRYKVHDIWDSTEGCVGNYYIKK